MQALCVELCEKSSLHGLQHLVSPRKKVWERVLWATLLSVVTVVTVSRVHSLWQATYQGSVLTVVEDAQYDLSLADFPAVTVCPDIKALDSKVRAVAKAHNVSENNLTAFEHTIVALSLMTFPDFNMPQEFIRSVNSNVYPLKGIDIAKIMSAVGPELDDVMAHCKWRSVTYQCKALFRRSLTRYGFCFTFNSKTKTLGDEYLGDLLLESSEDLIPLRSNVFGRSSGLGFRLYSLAQHKLRSEVSGPTYSVGVHNSASEPDFFEMTTVVAQDPLLLTQIKVSVSIVEADHSLYDLTESARGCSLSNTSGASLRCAYDCMDRVILELCHCLPYYTAYFQRAEPVCEIKSEQVGCLSDINHHLRFHQSCLCRQPCSNTFYTSDKVDVPVSPPAVAHLEHWTRVRIIYDSLAVKYSRTSKTDFREFFVGSSSYASLLIGFNAVVVFDFAIYLFKICTNFLKLCTSPFLKGEIGPMGKHEAPKDKNIKSTPVVGKSRIASKADAMFVCSCDDKQSVALNCVNHYVHPVYPYLN